MCYLINTASKMKPKIYAFNVTRLRMHSSLIFLCFFVIFGLHSKSYFPFIRRQQSFTTFSSVMDDRNKTFNDAAENEGEMESVFHLYIAYTIFKFLRILFVSISPLNIFSDHTCSLKLTFGTELFPKAAFILWCLHAVWCGAARKVP